MACIKNEATKTQIGSVNKCVNYGQDELNYTGFHKINREHVSRSDLVSFCNNSCVAIEGSYCCKEVQTTWCELQLYRHIFRNTIPCISCEVCETLYHIGFLYNIHERTRGGMCTVEDMQSNVCTNRRQCQRLETLLCRWYVHVVT